MGANGRGGTRSGVRAGRAARILPVAALLGAMVLGGAAFVLATAPILKPSGRLALAPLVVSAIFVAGHTVLMSSDGLSHAGFRIEGFSLTGCLDLASWNFTQSWGSNITAVGALLGGILLTQRSLLPAKPFFSETEYLSLNIFFGVLIIVAAFVYNSCRRKEDEEAYVATFLVSCTITLWAVLGECLTLIIFLQDLGSAKPVPGIVERLIQVFIGCAGVLIFVPYALFTVYATIKSQLAPPPPAAKDVLMTLQPAAEVSGHAPVSPTEIHLTEREVEALVAAGRRRRKTSFL